MVRPSLAQALHKTHQGAVVPLHQRLRQRLRQLGQVVAHGPTMILAGIRMTIANPTPMLVGIVVVIGLMMILPRSLSQLRIAARGATTTCVPTVATTALPTPAIVLVVAVTGCLQVPPRC